MPMSPNKGETAVHGRHCLHIREVLARPWVGVFVPLALSLFNYIWSLICLDGKSIKIALLFFHPTTVFGQIENFK